MAKNITLQILCKRFLLVKYLLGYKALCKSFSLGTVDFLSGKERLEAL